MSKHNYREEFVLINGTEHYLLHCPKAEGTPVLLYLHGGPGFSESQFAYVLDAAWGDLFTHVHWDQRGAGRTLWRSRGTAGNPTSLAQMVDDLHGVVEHLKRVYHTEKIVLMGHSWGSILGSLYLLQHPENVSAYIGSGQAVNMRENERVGYRKAMELAKSHHNQKQIDSLESIGVYPPQDFDELMKKLPVVRKVQDSYEKSSGGLLKPLLKSPTFKWQDFFAMFLASKANRTLIKELFTVDLAALGNRCEVPVHYLLGENDANAPTELSIAYCETLDSPGKSLTVIPDAGHNPMYEQPEAFAAALKIIREGLQVEAIG